MATIIITRHAGLIDWLANRGITGRAIAHATAEDVRDQDVIGVLPLHLAALASSITTIDMPLLTAEQRGRTNLSAGEMAMAGAVMRTYRIVAISRDAS